MAELRREEGAFSDQEIYRLRTIITNVKAQLTDEDE